MKSAAFLLALAACVPAMAQVYKCPDASGRTVLQQTPCAGGARVDAKPPAPPSQPTRPTAKSVMTPAEIARDFEAQVQAPHIQRELAIGRGTREAAGRDAVHNLRQVHEERAERCDGGPVLQEPVIGMKESSFLRCTRFARQWDARRVNETETQLGISRQYVYSTGAPINYVYTVNGKVTGIQR